AGLGQLAVPEHGTAPVLALPDGRRRVGPRPARPAVDAVPGEVEPPADEPGRPLRPARQVTDLLPRLRELEAHVGDRLRPKPLGLLGREAHEFPVVLEAEPPREPHRVRALADLVARAPDHLHAGKRNLTPQASAR